jgi:hypothetical protein
MDRIVLTHDINSMPGFFHALLEGLAQGAHAPGIFVVAQQVPIGVVVEDILMIWYCSTHEEWRNLVTFLPL